eukprot:jgi/Mesvir1/4036/Mv20909-RA.1
MVPAELAELDAAAAKLFVIGYLESDEEGRNKLIARGVSGCILFARNFQTAKNVSDVAKKVSHLKMLASPRPLLVAVDHEGGADVPFTRPPPMRALGAVASRAGLPAACALAAEVGRMLGRELRACGFDVNLAPVVDVDSNPANPVIGNRAFSADPKVVAALGAALLTSMQAQGVAAAAKHFPGHGDTVTDSHVELPVLEHSLQRLRAVELVPFLAAITPPGWQTAPPGVTRTAARSHVSCWGDASGASGQAERSARPDGAVSPTAGPGGTAAQVKGGGSGSSPVTSASDGVAMIMTAHVMFPALDADNPATMSEALIKRLLRDDLHYDGVVVSDDLEMGAISRMGISVGEAAVRSIAAGVDLLLCCHKTHNASRAIDAVVSAVRDGTLPLARVKEAGARVDGLMARFVAPPAHAPLVATMGGSTAVGSGLQAGHAGNDLSVVGCKEHRQIVDAVTRESTSPARRSSGSDGVLSGSSNVDAKEHTVHVPIHMEAHT